MDRTQVVAFIDYMIGWRPVGVAGEEEITEPKSPELRAYLTARLGDAMPFYANYIVPRDGHERRAAHANEANALAALLREVADVLSPPVAQPAPLTAEDSAEGLPA